MATDPAHKPVTYSKYLKVDELVDLQEPLSDGPEHDEMLFIIIHQVYELWFKQILHEFTRVQRTLGAGETHDSVATLHRIRTILKLLVSQVDILETMTPVSFSSFRARLDSASGFQSFQFREVEFILGNKRASMIDHHGSETTQGQRLTELLGAPTLYDSFLKYLSTHGFDVPADLLERDFSERLEPSPEVQVQLIEIYRQHPIHRMVCEILVDLDEGLQEWRYRHVKMVERTIGRKSGTGGSSGAEYLKSTLFRPLFPDLWEIRGSL